MTAELCAAALSGAEVFKRAEALDTAFPNCACERWALTTAGGEGIQDDELVARVLTSPDDYDETTDAIVTAKLTQIYTLGMSVIRQGASSDEIRRTVERLLTGAAEPKKLVGAIVVQASQIRSYICDVEFSRWFGLYATDDDGKLHHGDIFGTSASKKKQKSRRYKLAEDLMPLIVRADNSDELLAALRAAGI